MNTTNIVSCSPQQNQRNKNQFYALRIIFCLLVILFYSCRKDFEKISSSSAGNNDHASLAISRPNIVIILGDDIGYDAITSQGNGTFQTPNIDAMAQAGMRFTKCHSSPLCSPSRFMFVTGKYNFRNYDVWGKMNPNEKTFATLLRDAGYATCVFGKWQFDGGDASIRSLGFNDYCVWDPIEGNGPGPHYKNPRIYTNGAFVPSIQTQNKYGDDIFTDSVLSFIKENKHKNFFVYYPITLCHYPYSPTPDDSEYATWSTQGNPSDSSFFPSMIKYMDKKIGQIIDSLKRWSLYRNTIVMFVGDNGTPHHIFYYYNGVWTEGAKATSTEGGTHVTMIATWPNKTLPAQTNRNLIDFTDILPTLADAAGIPIPSDYGIIDGHSFYNQLTGAPYTPRDWIFCHYKPDTKNGPDNLRRWIQDTTYKLYDSTGKFYNIILDPFEQSPIKQSQMTPEEKQRKSYFQSVMDTLHL